MVRRNEAHLFGEREVEIEDTTVRAITSLIVDVPVRANVAPGMCAVYLLELLIQGTDILAAKRHKRHKINYFLAGEVLVFFFVLFVPFCVLVFFASQMVVNGGRSIASSLIETALLPP